LTRLKRRILGRALQLAGEIRSPAQAADGFAPPLFWLSFQQAKTQVLIWFIKYKVSVNYPTHKGIDRISNAAPIGEHATCGMRFLGERS